MTQETLDKANKLARQKEGLERPLTQLQLAQNADTEKYKCTFVFSSYKIDIPSICDRRKLLLAIETELNRAYKEVKEQMKAL